MKTPEGRIPPKDRPDFPSYDKAVWRDADGNEHKRYVVLPMRDGSGGYAIVDTENHADDEVRKDLKTVHAAYEFMRKHRAP